MQLYVGTSGYSYKEWKGSFYPEDLAAREMLSWYGERLNGVEINNTFYRLPKASVLESWAAQVPESFRFSIKASRRITHFTRLKPEASEPLDYLLTTLATLGERLGVVLFQMPPNLKKDTERLAGFLEMLPEGTSAAFEFRHESWKDEEVTDLVRARGMALVCADTDDTDDDEPIVVTAEWGYLRLRRPGYERDDLERWAARVRETGWKRAFVFFKHEDEGAGPRLASDFREVFDSGGLMSTRGDDDVVAFEAEIEATDRGGACVAIPFSVKAVWGTGGQVKVRATFDGVGYRGSVAPMGGGRHVLGVRKDVRAAIGKDVGDVISVTLIRDNEPRIVELPPELAKALDSAPDAAGCFEALSFTHRREFAQWVAEGKKQETRDRRSRKALDMLRTGQTR